MSIVAAMTAANASAVRLLHTDRTNNEVYVDNLQAGDASDWEVFIPAEHEWTLKDFDGHKAFNCTYDAKWNYSVISPIIDEKYTKNCTVSANYVFTEKHAYTGMMVRGSDEDTMYMITFGLDQGTPFAQLSKRLNQGQWKGTVIVPKKSVNITKNVDTNLEVTVLDNNIRVLVDGVEAINYTDESDPILEGRVGFMNQYGNTQMKSFKVTTIPGEDEPEEAAKYTYKNYVSYTSDEIDDFSDAIFDYYGWESYGNGNLYFENNNLIIISSPEKGEREAAVSYARKTLTDSPIEYAALGADGEYAVSFKNIEKYKLSSQDGDGYLLRVQEDAAILEKYIAGKCTELGRAEGEFMSADEYKEFRIDVTENGATVDILVSLGGEEIIACTDAQNAIIGDGYVSFISHLDELRIGAPQDKDLTEKQLLGNTACVKIGSGKMYLGGFSEGGEVYQTGAVMLPLRKFAALWGAEVSWNEADRACEINHGGNSYKIMSGYSDYFINGEKKTAKAMIENKNGTIYVPADFFEAEFGKKAYTTDSGLVFVADKDSDISGILENDGILAELNEKLKM